MDIKFKLEHCTESNKKEYFSWLSSDKVDISPVFSPREEKKKKFILGLRTWYIWWSSVIAVADAIPYLHSGLLFYLWRFHKTKQLYIFSLKDYEFIFIWRYPWLYMLIYLHLWNSVLCNSGKVFTQTMFTKTLKEMKQNKQKLESMKSISFPGNKIAKFC